jgi:hypothetical protein
MDAATFRECHKEIWGDNPAGFMANYKYLQEVTVRLDNTPSDGLDQQRLFEIALWKVNRYPVLSDELLAELWALKNIAPAAHRGARTTLCALLACRGVQLPMASTFLRFVNPKAFQIYDERAARMLWGSGHAAVPNKPASGVVEYTGTAADQYFYYLDDLRAICSPELPFESADRILYQLDIELGNKVKRR